MRMCHNAYVSYFAHKSFSENLPFFSTVEIFSGANTQFPSMSRDSRTQTCKIWTNTLRPEKQAGISESDGRVASCAFNVLACPSVRYGQLGPTSQKGTNRLLAMRMCHIP